MGRLGCAVKRFGSTVGRFGFLCGEAWLCAVRSVCAAHVRCFGSLRSAVLPGFVWSVGCHPFWIPVRVLWAHVVRFGFAVVRFCSLCDTPWLHVARLGSAVDRCGSLCGAPLHRVERCGFVVALFAPSALLFGFVWGVLAPLWSVHWGVLQFPV